MALPVNSAYDMPTPLTATDWGEVEAQGHDVKFYEDDAYLLDGLSQFIGSSLGAGHAAVVIATEPHRDVLRGRLQDSGIDVDRASVQGRYVALDAVETLEKIMVNGSPDAGTFMVLIGGVIERACAAAQRPNPRVAAFGEMVAVLWEQGRRESAIELERLWNALAETHAFHLQCAYPMRLFPREADASLLSSVCDEHTHVAPTERYTGLLDRSERLRAVTVLEQKALALEAEIEARKRLEQALLDRNRELREAVAARDEFVSVATHELRTPITALRLVAQSLLIGRGRGREATPERIASALSTIEYQTERLNRLMTRLLDYTRIGADKLQVEPVPTDLPTLIRSLLAERPPQADHPLLFEGPEHLEVSVDPLRFEQVLTNLVDNAIKFSPQGGPVELSLGLADPGTVRFCVTDHGVGIPPEQRDRVFDRFHQAHDRSHLSGLGLGLYITHEVVARHGGEIWIEEPGHEGTRFVVLLPIAAETASTSTGA